MPIGQRQRIRTVFLRPEESYALRHAARLLGMPVATLRRDVRAGHHDAQKQRGKWFLTWRQIALFAFGRWSLADIHRALGADAAHVLPPLLTLRPVTVRLPEYILRALELMAADERRTVDDVLIYELAELAGTVADEMEPRIPGFRQAYLFPGEERRRVR